MKHLTLIQDLSRKQIDQLISSTLSLKKNPLQFSTKLKQKIIAVLFFEPSTRTRLSFEAAAHRLGASVIGFSDPNATSYGSKGESFKDTIQIVSRYADLIVVRHPQTGAAQKAARVSKVPVINAGDGPNDHPTQTLLDLMTIQETQGKIDGLKIGLMGDLKNARVMRSLSLALSLYQDIQLFYISPPELKMKTDIKKKIQKRVSFREIDAVEKIVPRLDILYLIRIQKERFKNREAAEKLTGSYRLTSRMLKNAKTNLKILHCLPRREELAVEIDQTPFAYYFDQAQNGVWMRMALLLEIFKTYPLDV